MIDIVTADGPLSDERRAWVADLYGPVDAKYGTSEFLDNLFNRGPAGAALHAFALDDDVPVGHLAAIPTPAREGDGTLRCAKLEAFVVAEPYRGRRDSEEPVAVRLRRELYSLVDAQGFELLHAYVRPEVAHVLELVPVRVGERSFVSVLNANALVSRKQRTIGSALALGQRSLATVLAPARQAESRPPRRGDSDLVETAAPTDGRWTVLGGDAWEWYLGSPVMRVLELRDGTRAFVQLPGGPHDALRLVAWHAKRPGRWTALAAVRAAADVARAHCAATLRYQPWPASGGNAELAGACRALGFVRRDDFATLWVRTNRAELARREAIAFTPLLYVGF